MESRAKIEGLILKEIHSFPDELIPFVFDFLRGLKESLQIISKKKPRKTKETGFCGAWKDSRSAEEIIVDIKNNRSGFGNRKVSL